MGGANNRIQWIDEFKGFVLILVCAFHLEQNLPTVNLGMLHLSALRMSAFFFISGVLFSTRRFVDFKSFALHKTKVLLLPYLFLSLLFLALDPVIYHFEFFSRAPKMTILNFRPEILNVADYIYYNLLKIFVAGKSCIGSGPLWFVFTLYSVSLVFFGIQKVSANKIWVLLAATFSLFLGWACYKNHLRFPLGIERDFTTLFFFALGFLSKDFIKFLDQKLSGISPIKQGQILKNNAPILWCIFTVAITLISFIIYSYVEIPDNNFSIMNNDLGKSFWHFLGSSIFGIVGLVFSFLIFSKVPFQNFLPLKIIKGILKNISRNALIILAIHWWILLVAKLFFKPALNKPCAAYFVIFAIITFTILSIPLFRCKLYKLLGKEKISAKESLKILNS